MDEQNLSYALIQVLHNLGASAVVGGTLFILWPAPQPPEVARKLARIVLIGWAVQGASGAAFGATSYFFYGQLPDIHGIAVAALLIKMGCAAAGFLLAAVYLLRGTTWEDAGRRRIWKFSFSLAASALTAAAFLRWFS